MLYKKWEKINKRLDPSFKNRITHLQVYICIEKKKDKKEKHQKVIKHFYLWVTVLPKRYYFLLYSSVLQ